MRFKLYINTDNEAFSDNQGGEVSRILRDLADSLEEAALIGSDFTTKLRDYNGNTVGEAKTGRKGNPS